MVGDQTEQTGSERHQAVTRNTGNEESVVEVAERPCPLTVPIAPCVFLRYRQIFRAVIAAGVLPPLPGALDAYAPTQRLPPLPGRPRRSPVPIQPGRPRLTRLAEYPQTEKVAGKRLDEL